MNWQKHEDTCVPQKGDLSRGRFNHQESTHPALSFPSTPDTAQWAHEHIGHGVRDGG